ncbi:MAG: hypothetical protein ACK5OX_10735 [Desertimonas sp.]
MVPTGLGPAGGGGGRGNRTLAIVAAAGAALLIAAGGLFLLTDDDEGPTLGAPPVSSSGTDPGEGDDPVVTDFTLPELTLPVEPVEEVPVTPATVIPDTVVTGGGGLPAATIEPTGLGSDPVLDGFAAACYGGDMQACDELYRDAPSLSAYETYADTCAGRQPVGTGRFCVDAFGG